MPIQPAMVGFLDRTSWAAVPTTPNNFRTTTSGLNGVVSNGYWGDFQLLQPATFTAAIGSPQFLTDLGRIETTTTGVGPYSTIIANIQGVDNNLAPGAQTKIRFFQGVGAVSTFTNPPAPTWLYTLCGHFGSTDSTHNPPRPFWVSGLSQTSGDTALSPISHLLYIAPTLTSAQNIHDPSTSAGAALGWTLINPSSGAPGYSSGAGRCPNWYGASAANYLAAYSYWMLLMANCRLWVDNPSWVHPGDGGNWHAGDIGGNTGTAFTLDTCPMIGEVTMSACTTIYSEPCIRQISGTPANQYKTPTNASFLAAGYTWFSGMGGSGTIGNPAADSDLGQLYACQNAMAVAWPNTCISEANNPYQVQGGSPDSATSKTDIGTTNKLIANLINVCEPGQGTPGNNSLAGTAGYDNGIAPIVGANGGPTYFQTNTLSLIQGFTPVFQQGEGASAYNIELPAGYGNGSSPWITPTQLAAQWTLLQSYMSGGTGPSAGPAPAPNTTAYSMANTRNQAGGPVFANQTPSATGTVGSPFPTYTYTASGSSNVFDIVSGFISGSGLTLSSSGVLSGTPTTAGTYNFVVRVRNAGGTQTSMPQSIVIAVPATGPVFTNGQPPDMTLGVPYTFQLQTSPPASSWAPGGVAGLTGLPTGVGLNTSTGVVSGTPRTGTPFVPGGVTFAFKATANGITTLSPTYSVSVLDPFPVIPISAVLVTATAYGKVMA